MSKQNKKYILNLILNLGEFLTHYFSHDDFVLLERDEFQVDQEVDYIFVEGEDQLESIYLDFPSLKGSAQIISFSEIKEFKGFLLSYGRAILDKEMKENFINEFNLNRMFRDKVNIHLDEELSSQISEFRKIKITNHLMMGSFIDELSVLSFEKNFKLVPIRSFVDHVIYYYVYLKQAGLAGVPYEIEYGFADDFLVINTHVNVKKFVAEYMIDSFGDVNSNDPLKYILNIVRQSCDFLDISYVENPHKVCITGMFKKESGGLSHGVIFNHIESINQIVKNVDRKLLQYQSQDKRKKELEEKKGNLKTKTLHGGFESFTSGLSQESELKSQEELAKKLIEYMVSRFGNTYPHQNLSEFNEYHFEEFAPEFRPIEIIQNLSLDDRHVIIEKIRNFESIKAADINIQNAKKLLENDDQAIQSLNEVMGNGFAEIISEKVGLDDINQILAEKKTSFLEEEKKRKDDQININDAFVSIENPFDTDEGISNVSGILDDIDLDTIVSGEEPSIDETLEAIPGDGEGLEDIMNILGDIEEEDVTSTVSGVFDENEGMVRIGGGDDEPEDATLVKGGAEEADNFSQTIKGLDKDEKDGIMAVFSNSFDDDNKKGLFNFKSLGQKERDNQLRCFVKNTLDQSDKLKELSPALRAFIHKEAPKALGKGLNALAKEKGISVEELSEGDIAEFQEKKIPEILTDLLEDEKKIEEFKEGLENYFEDNKNEDSPFIQRFKALLERNLSTISKLEKSGEEFLTSEDDIPSNDIKNAIRDTVKESFDTELSLKNATKEEVRKKETQMVKELSVLLGLSQDEIRSMISSVSSSLNEKEEELLNEKLDNDVESVPEGSQEEQILIEKVKSLELENKDLKTKISAIQLQTEADKHSSKKIKDIQEQSKVSDEEIPLDKDDLRPVLNHIEKTSVLESLDEGSKIDGELLSKVKQVIDRENQLIEDAKNTEIALKKLELESDKKDSLMDVELRKAEKIIRGKDIVLDKAKESMKNLMEKKNKELLGFKNQVTELNQRLKDDKSVVLSGQVKALTSENENLQKMVDVYRSKVESMAKNIENKKKSDQTSGLSEENRNLKRTNAQLENKLSAESKLKTSLEEKYKISKEEEGKLKAIANTAKAEANSAQAELRTVQSQIKLLKDQNTKLVQAAAGAGKSSSKDVDILKAKNSKLKERVDSLTNKVKELEKGPQVDTSISVDDVSKNPERAKIELEKSFKEISLLKERNIKLNSKIEELEKSNDVTSIKSIDGAQESRDKFEDKQLRKELDLAKSQNDQLQANIKDLIEKLRKNGEGTSSSQSNSDQGSAKEKRLEQSVKKMNGELTKARSEASEKKKEAIKYKAEVNKLKNQVSRLEKDLEKAQRASSKNKKAA